MSCNNERQRLESAVAVLDKLWDDLAAAAPPKKPPIVAKIEAQNAVVDEARAAYETCIHQNDVPDTATSASFSLIALRSNDTRVFFNEANVSRIFRFSGPATARRFTLDPIIVTRTAVFNLGGIRGTLVPASGAMELSATVDIALFGKTATMNVSATTSPSTSPNGLFTLLGQPLNPADNSFQIVGTGFLDYPEAAIFGLEYAIRFDGMFATAP